MIRFACDRCKKDMPSGHHRVSEGICTYGSLRNEKYHAYDICDECFASFRKWMSGDSEIK